ncbi:MAG: response regulator transcription factor [Actinomycetota bacterium]|nr:response regulator transcription factor [Actinomycetota bacterium]
MTRAVIADDSPLLREGLEAVLALAGISVAAKTGSAAGLWRALAETAPDVVLVGIPAAPVGRDEAPSVVDAIRLRHPRVGVLVLSASLDAALALALISRRPVGAGYMLKQPVPQMAALVRALRVVESGGTFVDPAVIERLRASRRRRNVLDCLSEREREILALMAAGRTNSAICEAVSLSPKTVETHVRAIFNKLELRAAPDDHRRVLAVLRYVQSGDAARAATAGLAAAA